MKSLEAWLRSTKGLVASVTGLLIVLGSLISTGRDVYVLWSGAPRTREEAQQVDLYKKHRRESPVLTQPINVELENWTIKVVVDVYRNGDIFLTAGDNSSWFPFSPGKNVSLVREAYAQSMDIPSGKYIQTQREDGVNIVRERTYENGARETLVINQNTGRIIKRSVENRALSPEERAKIETGVPAKAPIDIKIK